MTLHGADRWALRPVRIAGENFWEAIERLEKRIAVLEAHIASAPGTTLEAIPALMDRTDFARESEPCSADVRSETAIDALWPVATDP